MKVKAACYDALRQADGLLCFLRIFWQVKRGRKKTKIPNE
jgi:hypothetical protein